MNIAIRVIEMFSLSYEFLVGALNKYTRNIPTPKAKASLNIEEYYVMKYP